MAQVSFMDGIMSIRGKLGDTIYRTTPSGKTIAYQKRHFRRTPPTEKELLQRKRFAIATRIARSAMYDFELEAILQRRFKSIPIHDRPKTLRGFIVKELMDMLKDVDL